MKILITGATGFIGTELVRHLCQGPHELRCFVRRTSRVDTLQALGVRLVLGDVIDRKSLIDAMRGCDWVVNLSGLFELWYPARKVYEDVNAGGTRNVMEAARETGVAKVVHVSTVVAYGDAAWPITEETPFGNRLLGDYCRTKRAGELIVREFQTKHRLPVVIIAPGAVVGPNDPKTAGQYVRDIAGGKLPAQVFTKSPFPFVHVHDVADAIVRALEKDGNEGEKYIVVAENLTFGEINRMIAELTGVRLPAITLPSPIALAFAHVMTALANVTGKPPVLGMSVEQFRMMKQGFMADSGKSRRELGLSYIPIRTTLEEILRRPPSGTEKPAAA